MAPRQPPPHESHGVFFPMLHSSIRSFTGFQRTVSLQARGRGEGGRVKAGRQNQVTHQCIHTLTIQGVLVGLHSY